MAKRQSDIEYRNWLPILGKVCHEFHEFALILKTLQKIFVVIRVIRGENYVFNFVKVLLRIFVIPRNEGSPQVARQ